MRREHDPNKICRLESSTGAAVARGIGEGMDGPSEEMGRKMCDVKEGVLILLFKLGKRFTLPAYSTGFFMINIGNKNPQSVEGIERGGGGFINFVLLEELASQAVGGAIIAFWGDCQLSYLAIISLLYMLTLDNLLQPELL